MDDEEEKLLRQQSVQSFFATFPDEEACLRMFPTVCDVCGPTTPVETEIKRSFTCSICRRTCWRTAKTFFAGMNKVLPGFLLTWLIEDQIKISISELSRTAGVVYSTAWEMVKRFRNLCRQEMMESDNLFEVATTIFDRIIFRRSKLTPAFEHPNVESAREEVFARPQPSFESLEEKALFETLSNEPIYVEAIAEKTNIPAFAASILLMRMELKSMVTRLPGDCFILKRVSEPVKLSELSDEQIGVIAHFLEYMKKIGSSRRYLQLSIAQFWATTNKIKWRYKSLFNTCMNYTKLDRRDCVNYKSPYNISMVAV